jgi:catechol 2,3-dioxygenase-like lactoylglutathione lyase family enzyme
MIEGISAITLSTHDMRRAVRFYSELGFVMLYGGEDEGFTSGGQWETVRRDLRQIKASS